MSFDPIAGSPKTSVRHGNTTVVDDIVLVAGTAISLPSAGLRTLQFLLTYGSRTVRADDLRQYIQSDATGTHREPLRVTLTRLRKALAAAGSNVEIVAIGNYGFEIRTLDMPRDHDAPPGSAQFSAQLATAFRAAAQEAVLYQPP